VDPNRLYQGDCVEGLGRLEAESVDLVFADPPFNIGYEYDVYEDRCRAEHYLDWTRRWGKAVQRVLKPTGTFWLAIGDEYAAELKLIFQKELGFMCRSWIVWYYTFGVNCTKKFSRSHAHLFHFVKDPKKFTFNNMAIRVPSARQLVYNDGRADSQGRLPDDTWILRGQLPDDTWVLRPQDLPDGFQPDEDTWYFSRVCGTFKERAGWHGCQMPEQLLGRIIKACSNPNDLVLDPFAGSGTTLAVAKKLGRRWIGFELSPNYAARVQARLDAAAEGQPLEGAEEPKVSAPRTPSRANGSAPLVPLRDNPGDIRRGILEAFFAARDGFSPDRVIADPELNERFQQMCRRLGLPGQPGEWNRHLMNLRKAKGLAGLPRARPTQITRAEFDQCGYACEIALQRLKEQGRTLDRVLCEPKEAAAFDAYVQAMIAEKVPSLRIRWVALHIRKRAKDIRQWGLDVDAPQPLPRSGKSVSSFDWQEIPQTPGLYWLRSPAKNLYVGETLNLQQRFKLQFERTRFGFWGTDPHDLELRYCELPVEDWLLKGNQSRWIADWKPIGNYKDFAAL
jgi:site-specific DNA-methyltransferase (adenine-specific)